MTKSDALNVIQHQIDTVIHPVELLHWCWLRVIITKIPTDDWERYVDAATVELAK